MTAVALEPEVVVRRHDQLVRHAALTEERRKELSKIVHRHADALDYLARQPRGERHACQHRSDDRGRLVAADGGRSPDSPHGH